MLFLKSVQNMSKTIGKIGVLMILLGIWFPAAAQQRGDQEALETKIEQLEAEVERLRSYNDEIRED